MSGGRTNKGYASNLNTGEETSSESESSRGSASSDSFLSAVSSDSSLTLCPDWLRVTRSINTARDLVSRLASDHPASEMGDAAPVEAVPLTEEEAAEIAAEEARLTVLRDRLKAALNNTFVSLQQESIIRHDEGSLISALSFGGFADNTSKDYRLLMEYQGFDPLYMLGLLIEKHSASSEEGTILINATQYKKKSDRVEEDLAFFATLFALRGANLGKIIERTVDEMGSLIKAKCAVYGIDFSVKPVTSKPRLLKKDEVTLGRIAGIVPHWVCSLHQAGHANKLCDLSFPGLEIPGFFMCQSFAAIAPTRAYLPLIYLVNTSIDAKLNVKRKKKSTREEIKRFADATFSGKMYSPEARMWIGIQAGYLGAGGLATATTLSVIMAAKTAWGGEDDDEEVGEDGLGGIE